MPDNAGTSSAGVPAGSNPNVTDELDREILNASRQAGGRGRPPGSRMALFPVEPSAIELLSCPSTASVDHDESSTPAHSFNAYVAKRVDEFSLLEGKYSLATLSEQLDRCRTVLRHFHAGQARRGLKGRAANFVALISHRILNWFITPSIEFDDAAEKSLSEITYAIDRMQRQIKIIATEVAWLRERAVDQGKVGDGHEKG